MIALKKSMCQSEVRQTSVTYGNYQENAKEMGPGDDNTFKGSCANWEALEMVS